MLKLRTKIKLARKLVLAVAATRAMMGFGAGLLAGVKMREKKRRRLAWALVGIGALTTPPLMRAVFHRT